MLRLPSFTYLGATTVEEAVRRTAEAGPEGMVVAGGTDLYPNMKRRQFEPKVLVGLRAIRDLGRISGDRGTGMTVGAGVTLADLAAHPDIAGAYRAVALAAIALAGRVRLVGPRGEREVPAAALYRDDGMDYLTKAPEEILTDVVLPAADGWKTTYWKLRRRGSFDFPILGVAAALRCAADGTVEDARIVLGAVASRPVVAGEAAALLRGQRPTPDLIARAAQAAFHPAKPLANADLPLGYRKKMTRVYVDRALRELAGLPFEGAPGGGAGAWQGS